VVAGRRRADWFLLACLLVLSGCDGGSSGGASARSADTTPVAATTSLPLQETALAIGGDVQTRATDLVSVGLTEEQVHEIEAKCKGAAEISPSDDKPCTTTFIPRQGQLPGDWPPCGPSFSFCLTVHAYSEADQQVLGAHGYVEIVEEEPDGPLCGADPAGVCLRLGARTAETLDRVVDPVQETTSSSPSESLTGSESGSSSESATPTESSVSATSTGTNSATPSGTATGGGGGATSSPASTGTQ
jgi:hypothetical protein